MLFDRPIPWRPGRNLAVNCEELTQANTSVFALKLIAVIRSLAKQSKFCSRDCLFLYIGTRVCFKQGLHRLPLGVESVSRSLSAKTSHI